jgi:hypothetical protein
MISVSVSIDPATARQLISSPAGPVVRDLLRRGNNVRNRALLNMRSMRIGAKTGTGALAQSIVVELIELNGLPGVRIGSRLPYAIYVHEGTGIYAGRGMIRPRSAKVLRWPAIASAGSPRRYSGGATKAYVFARAVKGVPSRPFLRDALSAAAD